MHIYNFIWIYIYSFIYIYIYICLYIMGLARGSAHSLRFIYTLPCFLCRCLRARVRFRSNR